MSLFQVALRERDREREREIEAEQHTRFEELSDALGVSAQASEKAIVALNRLHDELRQIILIHGSGRLRKPYVKQPGEQFARFENGRLTQYKRLVNGLVVKV